MLKGVIENNYYELYRIQLFLSLNSLRKSYLENPCVYWGGPRVTQPDLAAAQQLDLLMVQSQYDAATPLEGANRFFAQLPNARRVYVPGEYQHALFPYYDTCVDATIARYLLGETPAQRETVCPALPLKQDALASAAHLPPAQPKTAAHAAQPRQGTEPPTYLYPEEAQPLIGRFKDAMGRRRGS